MQPNSELHAQVSDAMPSAACLFEHRRTATAQATQVEKASTGHFWFIRDAHPGLCEASDIACTNLRSARNRNDLRRWSNLRLYTGAHTRPRSHSEWSLDS